MLRMSSTLKNLGNTCYINSIIHCLKDLILEQEDNINDTRELSTKLYTLCEAIKEYDGVISPITFVKQVKALYPKYNNTSQHDAHEFFMDLLDTLHEENKRSRIMYNPYGHTLHKESNKAWIDCVKQNSFISKNIFGQIIRTYKCRECEHTFNNYERYNTLDTIPHVSVKESLNRYFNFNDIVYIACDNCGKPERQQEHSVITKIIRPSQLLFILFKNKPKNNEIDIPLELDISDFSLNTEDGRSYTYTLKSLICHVGLHPEVGHYYNVHVGDVGDTFTIYNDNQKFTSNKYDKSHVYMMMYVRKLN